MGPTKDPIKGRKSLRRAGNPFAPMKVRKNIQLLSSYCKNLPANNYFIWSFKNSVAQLQRDLEIIDGDEEEKEDSEPEEVIQVDREKLRPLRERIERVLKSIKSKGKTIKSRYDPVKNYPSSSTNWNATYNRFLRESQPNSRNQRAPITNPRLSYYLPEVQRVTKPLEYKLLLEKQKSESQYFVNQPKIDSAVEADLAELPFSSLKFPSMDVSIDKYIEKYHKPIPMETLENDEQTHGKERSRNDDEDEENDDEEVNEKDLYMKIIDEVRLPKFKPKFRVKELFSPEWYEELKSNVKKITEERMEIEAEREKALEKYRRERVLKILESPVRGSKTAKSSK